MSRLIALCGLILACAAMGRSDDPPQIVKPIQDLSSLSLEQLMGITVEGAARHAQTLEDAPASVTIITAEDIHLYGYRTLAEALASVRGFYTGNNRTYQSVGVRGFNLPGDYASRIIVMVNGHNMANNILDFELYFGNDFPIDLNLIRRIEIIRGPSSALYGSNGVFATINIVTKAPEDTGPASLTASFGSFGERKGQIVGAALIGRNANVVFSGSVFNNSGESPLYFPEFNTRSTDNGLAFHMDGEKGYHLFSNLAWGNWSITAVFADRKKIQPISWGDTVFNDRGTSTNDTRNYVEAAYTRAFSSGTLKWRTYYDAYHERNRFDYPNDSGMPGPAAEENRQAFLGDWIGTELTYRFDLAHVGALTIGSEAKFDLRNLQTENDIWPISDEIMNIDHRDRSVALFAQDERKLSRHWTFDLGLRFDYSSSRQNFLSPRAALIYQPSSVWSYKFLYGLGFRNPSPFELFFNDGLSGAPNPNAFPEKTDTVEVDVERKIGKRLNLLVSGYGYRLRDLLEGVYLASGLLQYQNVGNTRALGLEFEINGRPANWLGITASYCFQKATDTSNNALLENSPNHLAKLRFAMPAGRRFDLSSGMQYYSSRISLAAATVAPVFLTDVTLTSKHLLPDMDIQFGIRNAFNRKYFDPIALNPVVDTMLQPGRSFFVELVAHAAR